MIDSVLDLLRCPVCTLPLTAQHRSLRCPSGHSFDLARHGYVNLLTRQPKGSHADSAEMIAARERFLAGGHYRSLADRLARTASQLAPPGAAILEAGAGTAYYLARVINTVERSRGIAADLSVSGARRAARADDRIGAIVADTWAGLPIKDAALDLIMVVFAPRNPADFARLLGPGGVLLIATAAEDHLAEVRDRLGMIDVRPGKQQALRESLQDWFDVDQTEQLRTELSLDHQAIRDLVLMGPNAHHQHGDLETRIKVLPDPTIVTLSVEVSAFRRR